MERGTAKSLRAEAGPSFRGPLQHLHRELAPVARRLGLRVFLVGGAVRNLLEGAEFSGEWDVVVLGGGNGGARELAEEVSRARGRQDLISFPRFGTFLVPGETSRIEISQSHLRTRMPSGSGDPLLSDAHARDFTVNALYISLSEGDPARGAGGVVTVLDPCGRGIGDLKDRLLRTPASPQLTLRDDPLRIFRAARFCAAGDYRVHPALGRGARQSWRLIPAISAERVLEEMNRLLMGLRPSRGLSILARWNAFALLMPEIHAMVGFRQDTPYHYPDLFRHTLRVVDRCPADLPLRWAALLHDCGKPSARSQADGVDRYHGHEALGGDLARQLLTRLKAGKKLIAEVETLVRLHMVHYQEGWSDRAVRRFVQRAGDHLPSLLNLVEADSASLRLRRGKLLDLRGLRRRVEELHRRVPPQACPLDGCEVMDLLDIGPGPQVGRAMQALVEAVMEGETEAGKEAARRYLVRWWREGGDRSP